MAGIIERDGVYTFDGEGDPEQMANKLTELMLDQVMQQRARLDAENPTLPWWSDIVFLTRDLNGMSNLIAACGQEQIAEAMGEIVSTSIERLLRKLVSDNDEEVAKLMHKLAEDGRVLDAILSKVVAANFSGANVEQ